LAAASIVGLTGGEAFTYPSESGRAAVYQSGPYLISAAYPIWYAGSYPPEVIPFQHLHRLGHSFVMPGENGALIVPTGIPMPELIEPAHAANTMVTLGAGGAESHAAFEPVAANPAYRARFVHELTDFVVQHGYDGVSIDWEFPQSSADRDNLNALMSELRTSLDATGRDLQLSIAVSSGEWYGRWIDTGVITPLVDYYVVMTFNYHGEWSDQSGHNTPLYPPSPGLDSAGSISRDIDYWTLDRGVPSSKILLGLAFFGNSFNSEDLYQPFTAFSQASYRDIEPLVGNGYTYYWDNVSQVPYLRQDNGPIVWSYDNVASIRRKCDYVIENRLGGVAIWDLAGDLINGRQRLLEAVADKLMLDPVAYLPIILKVN
jgi:chitinase